MWHRLGEQSQELKLLRIIYTAVREGRETQEKIEDITDRCLERVLAAWR